MAKFIGSEIKDGNWGEDHLIEKLMEYMDDNCIIYRNRPILGAEFDVCLLIPDFGIIIFEVKAWKAETILRVENGDKIVIKTIDPETKEISEESENPTKQVRGYVYKMTTKIRNKIGNVPLIYGMVCFPNISKKEYEDLGLETVCECSSTLLRDDLETKAKFNHKMNCNMQNYLGVLNNKCKFDYELMYRTRQIFESKIKLEDKNVYDTDYIDEYENFDKSNYSVLAYIPYYNESNVKIESLAKQYSIGTKMYLFVDDKRVFEIIIKMIESAITDKGLISDGLNLKINYEGDKGPKTEEDSIYERFNCSVYLLPKYNKELRYFEILDGKNINCELNEYLKFADEYSNFNIEQYKIEHTDTTKNIIVKAGAGTGKTFTMISRIAFICHTQKCSMKEMINRIVLITFTDDAAAQMENKIKQYFNNYYYLTGDVDCLAFINQIENMQISTIHSYAKKIISMLGFEYGYGIDVSVTSGDYKKKQIIAKLVDKYVVEKQKKYGKDYTNRIGMPIYLVNKHLLNMSKRLHNQSINVLKLTKENFGNALNTGIVNEFHNLVIDLLPVIEKEYDDYLKEQNKIQLNEMMSLLNNCITNDENVKRLIKMQTGRPQFMFIDEFQDTDDVQIEALKKIAELLQFKMFAVGDIKQCIYRFRGAKENAFDKLAPKKSNDWEIYSLYKNYRTDSELLNIFHNSFSNLGNEIAGDEPLLMYGTDEDNSSRLVGTRDYNSGLEREIFYRKISISDEDERTTALFEEITRQKKLIEEEEKKGRKFSAKEKEIVILVRENWQAEIIKKDMKTLGIDVITNTGGDLYRSEPAIDMLKLVNALLHFDEADYLYSFVSSNFISGIMSKSKLYELRDEINKSGWRKKETLDNNKTLKNKQVDVLVDLINRSLAASKEEKWNNWNSVIKSLRITPVLQVVRKLYFILKPWVRYDENSATKQNYYRLNVDLLFEELINTVNMDSLTINSLANALLANVISQKNVDSRMSDTIGDEIVIRCVTVHKSKGLEYGSVILPYCSYPIDKLKRTDMNISVVNDKSSGTEIGYQIRVKNNDNEDVFQNNLFNENMEKNERMREETRILYVAMTRAIRSFSWISLNNRNYKSWQKYIWEEK